MPRGHEPSTGSAPLTPGGPPRHGSVVPLVLDLLRHGHALPVAEGGDALRRLSARGQAEIGRLAGRLEQMGWRPERAFTSPLARARETAEIVLRVAAPDLAAEPLEALRPESHPDEVLGVLAEGGTTAGHVLLVGHQPLLGLLSGLLTGQPAPELATGSLVRIEFDGAPALGAGTLTWRTSP